MRRLFLLTLFFVLALCASVFGGEISITQVNSDSSGTVVEYLVTNNSESKIDKAAVIACYDNRGILIDYEINSLRLEPVSKAYRHMETDVSPASVKAYLWNSTDKMMPDCKSDTYVVGVDTTTKWNFADDRYYSLGDITEVTEIDGLTLNYSNKAMKFVDNVNAGRCLYLFGGGKTDDCSVSFDLKKPCTLRVYAASTDFTAKRTIKLLNSKGVLLNSFTADTITVNDYKYNGSGEKVFLMSASSGIYIYRIEVYYDEEPARCDIKNIYADSFSLLQNAIRETEAAGGGNVYIDTDYMLCNSGLYLSFNNADVNICAAEGKTPVLDFSPMQSKVTNTAQSVENHAIIIRGSNYSLKGFIVEKAAGGGIRLHGEKSHDNIISNVVTRYNNGGGIGIFKDAYNNTVEYCDSYRNCDVYTAGGNADGFQAGIDAGANNKFINCRAWENSDDGYDNFANYNDVTYIDCVAWNNGNPAVFTGLYDYLNKKPLDENMELVKIILSYDPEYKTRYNNRKFGYPKDNFINITDNGAEKCIGVLDFIDKYWAGNPNGFKLGSGDSVHGPQVGAEAKRTLINCVAFDHISKGIDRNNGIATINLQNCIAYDNGRNYWTDGMNVEQFTNAISFNGKTKDLFPEGYEAAQADESRQQEIRSYISDRVNYVVEMVQSNKIPGRVIFYPEG